MGGDVIELLSDRLLEEGIEKGREEERVENLFRIMKTGNVSYFQACRMMGFSKTEQNKCMESMVKKLEQEGYDLNGNQISKISNNEKK